MSISRFITKPLARAISKSILGEGSVFNPLSLFANGEEGAWYDPSDLTTLYQDSSGTIPVTTDGDPVGLMLDKSGNGNHATQGTSGLKPIYRTDGTLHWLEFDAFDDFLASLAYSQMSTDGGTCAAALEYGAGGPYFIDADDSTRVAQWLRTSSSTSIVFSSGGTAYSATTPATSEGIAYVMRSVADVSSNELTAYVNASAGTPVAIPGGVQTLAEPLSIGRRKTQYSNIDFYGLIQLSRPVTETEGADVDALLAEKIGVTL